MPEPLKVYIEQVDVFNALLGTRSPRWVVFEATTGAVVGLGVPTYEEAEESARIAGFVLVEKPTKE
jgi:hypothetical protein